MAEVPAQNQPQVATTPKSTNWKKIGLTVLIILVVTGLIAGVYWFFILDKSSDTSDLTGPVPKVTTKTSTESATEATPSSEKDETADWVVYSNTTYSVKIPPGWVQMNAPAGAQPVTPIWLMKKETADAYKKDPTSFLPNILITVESDDSSGVIKTGDPVTIDGVKGLRNKSQPYPTTFLISSQVLKSGKAYTLKLQDETSFNFEAIFNKVVSTFKILD